MRGSASQGEAHETMCVYVLSVCVCVRGWMARYSGLVRERCARSYVCMCMYLHECICVCACVCVCVCVCCECNNSVIPGVL
jgi:hypothetical protein